VYDTLLWRPQSTEDEDRKRDKRIIDIYTQAPENVKKGINDCFEVLSDWPSFEQLIQKYEKETELGKSEHRWTQTLIGTIQVAVGDLERSLTPLGKNRRSDDLRTTFHNLSEESRNLIDQIFEEMCEYWLSDVIIDGDTPRKAEPVVVTDYIKRTISTIHMKWFKVTYYDKNRNILDGSSLAPEHKGIGIFQAEDECEAEHMVEVDMRVHGLSTFRSGVTDYELKEISERRARKYLKERGWDIEEY
jgi:hypothetical protein